MNAKPRLRANTGRRNRSLRLESLQDRALMAADVTFFQAPIETSAAEQMAIELINRARSNPTQEAERLKIKLNDNLPANSISTVAKPPLTPNDALLEASRSHSADMLGRQFFAHVNPDGETPNDRAIEEGYLWGAGENIAYNYQNDINQAAVESAHDLLFKSAGHRQNVLRESYDHIGIGFTLSPEQNFFRSPMYTTQKFGLGDRATSLTGVVFEDRVIDNDFYSMGEGLSDILIQATDSQGQIFSTSTNEAGGYTLKLPPETYQVVAVHPSGAVTGSATVQLANENVKLDFELEQFSPPQNDQTNLDVNGDGIVSAVDVLQIVNQINHSLPYHIRYDMNQDGYISPIDALLVINEFHSLKTNASSPLNANSSGEAGAQDSDQVVKKVETELADEIAHARDTVSTWLGVPPHEIEVEAVNYVRFKDNHLGASGRIAGQSLTDGYQIILRYRTAMYDFRGAHGSLPTFTQYGSINEHLKDNEDFCCPWETLDQHCLAAIDAALEEFSDGILLD